MVNFSQSISSLRKFEAYFFSDLILNLETNIVKFLVQRRGVRKLPTYVTSSEVNSMFEMCSTVPLSNIFHIWVVQTTLKYAAGLDIAGVAGRLLGVTMRFVHGWVCCGSFSDQRTFPICWNPSLVPFWHWNWIVKVPFDWKMTASKELSLLA